MQKWAGENKNGREKEAEHSTVATKIYCEDEGKVVQYWKENVTTIFQI